VSAPPEAKFKGVIRQILKDAGFWFFAPVAGRNIYGIPDIIACSPLGYFLAVEVKVNTDLTPLQEKTLHDIREHGGIAVVVKPDSLEEFKRVVSSMTQI